MSGVSMMKCTACGKEFDEGFPYCPWCGSKSATTDDVATARRIATEEKLRDLRHSETAYGIVAVFSFIVGCGGVLARMFLAEGWARAPAHLAALYWIGIAVLFVISIICLVITYRRGKQREGFVKKLEKGKLE